MTKVLKTYEQFYTTAVEKYGQTWADEHAANYARDLVRQLREKADRSRSKVLAESCRRVADLMDPDLPRPDPV